MALFDCTIEATSGHARALSYETAHGTFHTPMFMPVGTSATVKGITVDQLKDAVDRGETGLLTKVPGIGKKTAERLVLELKGKLAGTGAATAAVPTSGARADVAAALIALGYSEREAAAATKKLPEDCTVNDGLRLALKSLTH